MAYESLPEKKFKFIDLFAGIGGFRLGLEAIGGQCIASSEIDTHANRVYQQNWQADPKEHNLGDICKIQSLPEHDLLVGGVPCQSWSIAGKNRGIEDPRGKLWLEVIRLLRQSKPTAFIFENVKGLYDLRHRAALTYLLDSFSEIGYQIHYHRQFKYEVQQVLMMTARILHSECDSQAIFLVDY
jgi:DNA (cytosine-5)-methyltransferase 1